MVGGHIMYCKKSYCHLKLVLFIVWSIIIMASFKSKYSSCLVHNMQLVSDKKIEIRRKGIHLLWRIMHTATDNQTCTKERNMWLIVYCDTMDVEFLLESIIQASSTIQIRITAHRSCLFNIWLIVVWIRFQHETLTILKSKIMFERTWVKTYAYLKLTLLWIECVVVLRVYALHARSFNV